MFVSRERIAEEALPAWVNLRFANARKTMEEITTGDMEYSNRSGVQEGGPCKCNDVSHVMIWDGVEHERGSKNLSQPMSQEGLGGRQTLTSYRQVLYEMYKDNITLVSLDKCHVGFTLSRSPMSEVTYQPAPHQAHFCVNILNLALSIFRLSPS
jgi:hypothetical protein